MFKVTLNGTTTTTRVPSSLEFESVFKKKSLQPLRVACSRKYDLDTMRHFVPLELEASRCKHGDTSDRVCTVEGWALEWLKCIKMELFRDKKERLQYHVGVIRTSCRQTNPGSSIEIPDQCMHYDVKESERQRVLIIIVNGSDHRASTSFFPRYTVRVKYDKGEGIVFDATHPYADDAPGGTCAGDPEGDNCVDLSSTGNGSLSEVSASASMIQKEYEYKLVIKMRLVAQHECKSVGMENDVCIR